jgi:outer membrane receptor protein involved in Fe transport
MTMSRHAALYLGASALALLSGHAAFGQAAPPAPEGAPEQVVVTGSLLGAANFAAPTPVTQISGVQIQTIAPNGIGTVISQLPFAAPGGGLITNTNGINGAGTSYPNLRGIGQNDTLVLIDGMRPTPVNQTNNFDVDMIPQSLLDRFEVVTTGASATYGSDAVAGAVNFILKDHLEGFTSDARFGISQRGDEDQSFFSAAWGTTLLDGRGHFEIGGEWANEFNTVNEYARPWGRNEPYLVAVPAAAQKALGLPANILTNHAEVDNGTQGGLITGCYGSTGASVACPASTGFTQTVNGVTIGGTAFNANGQPFSLAAPSVAGSSYMIGSGNYGASGLNRQLSPPYERWAGLARFEYDITPDITAYAMVNYGELQTDDTSQGAPFPIDLKVYSGNPFIPASIQALMTANNLSAIEVNKENLDGLGTGNTADDKNILVQSFFGVKGPLPGLDDWNWNLEGSAGRATVWQAFLNVPASANLDAAADVVQTPSGPACNVTLTNHLPFLNPTDTVANAAQVVAQAYPNCVPYNPFGVPSAASVNYINNLPDGPDGHESNIRQYMIQGTITGQAFNLPAGPVDLAFGGNYRYNSYDTRGTPPAAASFYTALDPLPDFVEKQSVYEFFGETGIPVLRDVALGDISVVKALDFSAAGRYSNYSVTGGIYTWKYGATLDVNDWLRLRVTRSQDARAPNFTEISTEPGAGATNLQNPIDGVSERFSNLVTSGSPTLKPEISQNLTYGAVVQGPGDPGSFLSGFRASVDYYQIRISGEIATPADQFVINECLLQQVQAFCQDITFSPGFTATSFTPTSTAFGIQALHVTDVNLNSEVQDGIDINVSQRIPLDGTIIPGAVQLSALGSYIDQQTTYQTTVGANNKPATVRINNVDTGPVPRWAVNANLTYLVDKFTANLQMRYYSPILYSTTLIGPNEPNYSVTSSISINRNLWPASITWNLALTYDLIQEPNGKDLQVYFNVNNLLDKSPPIIWSYVSNYDVVGRYFMLGVRYTMP